MTLLISCQSSVSEIIFETDFAGDTGYKATNVLLWNGGQGGIVAPPTGWDGVRVVGGSILSVETGEGVNGSNALKLQWDPSLAQPTINLGKHLTGDINTGYNELYIRYHVRLPNNFKAGTDGSYLPYWKWGRLWQNTSLYNGGNNNWTENRADSFYVVWNFGDAIPYTDVNAVWCANSGENLELGSAGGERVSVDWFISGSVPHSQDGYFEHMGLGEWELNNTDQPGFLVKKSDQKWHTVEYHFKLATANDADDGVMELWYDGIKQTPYSRIQSYDGDNKHKGIPTTAHGSGFNFFSFFDNMAGWNSDWDQPGVDGFILINDVVVSTSYIGHEYVVGITPPSAPVLNNIE